MRNSQLNVEKIVRFRKYNGVPTVFICKLRLRSILIWSGIEVYFFINLYPRPSLCPVPLALYTCFI